MQLRFVPLTLRSFDTLETEALCVWGFTDQRPPRGAAGWLDWRLCGRLSRYLADGTFGAASGEALLLAPPEQRLKVDCILWLGAGLSHALDGEGLRSLLADALRRLVALRCRAVALSLPHTDQEPLGPELAIALLLELVAPWEAHFDEILLLETPEAERAMTPFVARARKRAELPL